MLVSFLFLIPKSFLVSKQGKLLDMDEKWMTHFQCAMERSVRSYSREEWRILTRWHQRKTQQSRHFSTASCLPSRLWGGGIRAPWARVALFLHLCCRQQYGFSLVLALLGASCFPQQTPMSQPPCLLPRCNLGWTSLVVFIYIIFFLL